MEMVQINEDIRVWCMAASSFPDGIAAAHHKLHSRLPATAARRFFGISCPNENGTIMYKAAAEQQNEKMEDGEMEEFIIKKGTYNSMVVTDYSNNIPDIGKAFEKLLAHPQIDPNGVCVEVYLNSRDMQCMVRLQPENHEQEKTI